MNTLINPHWKEPLWPLAVDVGTVHLWRIALDQPCDAVILSADEKERAARFVFDRDRQRYIVARTALRAILAHYLGITPESVRFQYNERGKPALHDDAHSLEWQFNLSHAHELALMAVTRTCPVGVDVEYVRPVEDMLQLAARTFSARENQHLAALPAELQPRAFFNLWTRKEAYIKALGDGLATPLDEFDVSQDEPAALLNVQDAPGEAAQWVLRAFTPAPGYVGAVAARAQPIVLEYWQW